MCLGQKQDANNASLSAANRIKHKRKADNLAFLFHVYLVYISLNHSNTLLPPFVPCYLSMHAAHACSSNQG